LTVEADKCSRARYCFLLLQTSAAGQTIRYTLDRVSGLTQVLDGGGYTYLYGNGRVAQYGAHGGEYFLGDALGSVRQLVDASGAVRLTRSYQPYGELLASNGDGESMYGFTGEATDALTGMVYLRARWYAPQDGRFTSKDVWRGEVSRPGTFNAFIYGLSNPVLYHDPSGFCAKGDTDCLTIAQELFEHYGWLVTIYRWPYLDDVWTTEQLYVIREVAKAIVAWFDRNGGNGEARLRGNMGIIGFTHVVGWPWLNSGIYHVIGRSVYVDTGNLDKATLIHEMGHILDNVTGESIVASLIGGGPSDKMAREALEVDPALCRLRFFCPSYPSILRDVGAERPPTNYGHRGPSEDFAETFLYSVAMHRGLAPERTNWIEKYAHNLTKTMPLFDGQPYAACRKAIPVPTPPSSTPVP
jgi:RHS repeat-associated protein